MAMPQGFGVDQNRVFARGYYIVPVAIHRPKKISGAHYSADAPVESARGRFIFAGG
jgi:hypothetical protein